MTDLSIDPSLSQPLPPPTQDTSHLLEPQGVPSHDIFNTNFDAALDPTTYYLTARAALENAPQQTGSVSAAGDDGALPQGDKKSGKSKGNGPSIRKRSGWNLFYKEQFAIYHANNPPSTKLNARERSGFPSYAAEMWKQLSQAEREAYATLACVDNSLAGARPLEKLRRRRAGLLDAMGRVVTELETEYGVESLCFWSERDTPSIQPDGSVPANVEGESFGIVGSYTASQFSELMRQAQLGPQQFMMFIQQRRAPTAEDAQESLLTAGARKRKRSPSEMSPDLTTISADDMDISNRIKKITKLTVSRDYHDAEFRRLLLALLNNNLPPGCQKTRLPRGFFGPYLEKLGLELLGLPEKPVEIGEGGKTGGWSAEALRKNLEAMRANRVYIRRLAQPAGEAHPTEFMNMTDESIDEGLELGQTRAQEDVAGVQEEEAARILSEGAGNRRVGRK